MKRRAGPVAVSFHAVGPRRRLPVPALPALPACAPEPTESAAGPAFRPEQERGTAGPDLLPVSRRAVVQFHRSVRSRSPVCPDATAAPRIQPGPLSGTDEEVACSGRQGSDRRPLACGPVPTVDLDVARANGYAIAYRLIGDRPAARAVVSIVVERAAAAGLLDRPDWICSVAVGTVAEVVGPVGSTLTDQLSPDASNAPSGDDGLRVALRRRLSSASDDERTASSLHHLAGYPVETVAGFMGRPVEEVTRLVGVLSPPPGVSYRALGDPELIGSTPVNGPRRRAMLNMSTLLSIIIVVALVLGASRCVGPRPALGPAPLRVPVSVGPSVAAQPSSGCSVPGQAPGTFNAEAPGDAGPVVFRLAVPPTTAPPSSPSGTARALVVMVGDGDATPSPSQVVGSDLERQGLDRGVIVASVAPPAAGTAGNDPTARVAAVASVIDRVASNLCVDTSRVTVTGFGTGAQVTTVLACTRPRIVTVAAPVAGASMPAGCDLSPAVSLLLRWNADDVVMPPAGGFGSGPGQVPGDRGLPATPAGKVSRDWANAIGAGRLQRSLDADGTAVETATAPDGAAVRSVITASGGHAWSPADSTAVLDFAAAHARAPS